MKKQSGNRSKRQYSKPQLSIHGSVEDLTKGAGGGDQDAPVGAGGTIVL
jgi:hypothetical protein